MMNYPESLVRHLMRTVRCSVCEATYEPENVNVLGHQDELWFVSVRCASCQTQGLIAALVRDGAADETYGAAGSPLAAESAGTPGLPAADRPPHPDAGPITDADVADMRDFLETFEGSMGTLLGSR
jgi:hypothetical protein